MHAARQEQPQPIDPIRSLANSMRENEVMRVYRRVTPPDRLERLCEWPSDIAGDSQFIRETFGCGKYTVRVMKRRNNDSLVIRTSVVVDITRWNAEVAS